MWRRRRVVYDVTYSVAKRVPGIQLTAVRHRLPDAGDDVRPRRRHRLRCVENLLGRRRQIET